VALAVVVDATPDALPPVLEEPRGAEDAEVAAGVPVSNFAVHVEGSRATSTSYSETDVGPPLPDSENWQPPSDFVPVTVVIFAL